MTEIDLLRKAIVAQSEQIKRLQADIAKAFRFIEDLQRKPRRAALAQSVEKK